MEILKDERTLSTWSHRILLIPRGEKLIESAQSKLELEQRTEPKLRKQCALTCSSVFMACAKTLAKTPRLAKVLLNIQFCAPDGITNLPSKEGLDATTQKITKATAPVRLINPLAAILIDLRPNLDMDNQTLRNLVDEDRFWEVRRELVKDICLTLHRAIGLPIIAVSYDPMADEELPQEIGKEASIEAHLIVQHYEQGEMTTGYYATPHPSNTVVEGSRASGWIAAFIRTLRPEKKEVQEGVTSVNH